MDSVQETSASNRRCVSFQCPPKHNRLHNRHPPSPPSHEVNTAPSNKGCTSFQCPPNYNWRRNHLPPSPSGYGVNFQGYHETTSSRSGRTSFQHPLNHNSHYDHHPPSLPRHGINVQGWHEIGYTSFQYPPSHNLHHNHHPPSSSRHETSVQGHHETAPSTTSRTSFQPPHHYNRHYNHHPQSPSRHESNVQGHYETTPSTRSRTSFQSPPNHNNCHPPSPSGQSISFCPPQCTAVNLFTSQIGVRTGASYPIPITPIRGELVRNPVFSMIYRFNIPYEIIDGNLIIDDIEPRTERWSEETIRSNLKTRTYVETQLGTTPCAICLCDFEKQEKIGILYCGHEYHANCLVNWLLVKNQCPTCRSSALPIGNKGYVK